MASIWMHASNADSEPCALGHSPDMCISLTCKKTQALLVMLGLCRGNVLQGAVQKRRTLSKPALMRQSSLGSEYSFR